MARTALILVCLAGLLEANGIIIPPPPPPIPHPGPRPRRRITPAAVKDVSLRVVINDQVAKTEVEEIFVNPNPQPLEGTFVLPIPPDAQVSNFTFWINGKEIQGELLPRDKAQQYYRQIVARIVDPALLEYMDKGLVRVKLFPIPPRGEAKIRFSYSQILPSEGEQLTYYYPFGTNKFSSRPLNQAVVDVRVRSSVPLRAIYSPRYEVDVARKGEREARIGFEKKNFVPKEDFLLYIGRSEADFGVTSLAYRTGREDGYLLLVVSPKQTFGPAEFIPKDIVFVLDTSGSMAGEKIEQAREALSFCVRSLGPKDRFNLVPFSTQAQCFMPQLGEANGENKKKALGFIKELKALGGTNIDEALDLAIKQGSGASDRPFMVVFLTDGQPTVGETDHKQIVSNVAGVRPEGLRLFVFGVGDDVNTLLLDRLAEENRGTRQYVRPKENLEVRVSSFYEQVARPVLSDVTVTFSRGGVYDIYPPRIHDVFHGRQIIMVGRYRECGDQVFEISGKCAGKEYSYRFPLSLHEKDARADYLPRLWATRKIGYLLDEIRLHGQKTELVEEVKSLASRFGILTPYTSYLVQEDKVLTWGGGRRGGDSYGFAPRLRLNGLSRGLALGEPPAEEAEALAAPTGAAGAYGRSTSSRSATRTGRSDRARASGKEAVDESVTYEELKKAAGARRLQDGRAERDAGGAEPPVRYVGSKTFYLTGGVWEDSTYKKDMEEEKVIYLSEEYFTLLAEKPELGQYFALGKEVVVCLDGVAYRITEKTSN